MRGEKINRKMQHRSLALLTIFSRVFQNVEPFHQHGGNAEMSISSRLMGRDAKLLGLLRGQLNCIPFEATLVNKLAFILLL